MRHSHPQIIRRGSRALTAALVALLATLALAATSAAHLAKSKPAAPVAGAWQITGDLVGTFTIAAKHHVTAFQGTVGSSAESACGTGMVAVAGTQTIFDAKGTDPEGKKYSEWVVGKNEPNADPVIQPIKVTLTVAGQTTKGSLYLVFSTAAELKQGSPSSGEIIFTGTLGGAPAPCDLQFGTAAG